jgi:branched-chain amino acid transport system permease protein
VNGAAAQVVAGLAAGAVYGLLALGIVLVHRACGIVNLAQASLATLSAFVCSSLVAHGWAFWPAFGVTVFLSFAGGVAVHAVLIRPLQDGPLLAATALTAGLLLAVDGLDRWLWGGAPRPFDHPFSATSLSFAGVTVGRRELGVFVLGLGAASLLGLILRGRLGLGLRAAAANPSGARYAGVPARALTTTAWGLAGAVGAVAGVLAAPLFGLDPAMLHTALLYALAAAAVAGLGSTLAVVPAALLLGVTVELVDRHVHWLHGGVSPVAGLAVLLVALAVRRS